MSAIMCGIENTKCEPIRDILYQKISTMWLCFHYHNLITSVVCVFVHTISPRVAGWLTGWRGVGDYSTPSGWGEVHIDRGVDWEGAVMSGDGVSRDGGACCDADLLAVWMVLSPHVTAAPSHKPTHTHSHSHCDSHYTQHGHILSQQEYPEWMICMLLLWLFIIMLTQVTFSPC